MKVLIVNKFLYPNGGSETYIFKLGEALKQHGHEVQYFGIKKLPKMYFTNITGGEPFIRTDLKDIVRELYKKSDRIVISTNGFFTDRIVDLCKEFPQIGIRISIEGLEQTNNEIRGLQNGYQRGYGTLKKLREMGMKDVGFGMTVQDKNAPDLVPLYKISDEMGMEFATASLHNSFYFVEAKNIIHQDNAENGYYEQAHKIVNMATMVISSYNVVMRSRMTALFVQKKKKEFEVNFNNSLHFISMLVFPMSFGMAGIAANLVPWFLGIEYGKVTTLLLIFCPMFIIQGLRTCIGYNIITPTGMKIT